MKGEARQNRSGGEDRAPLPPLPPLRPAARLAGGAFAVLLRLLGATWRRRTEGLDRLDRMLAQGKRVLVVFWHGDYLPLCVLIAGRQACIFTSRSFRGEVIAAICRRFGYAGRPLPVAPRGKVEVAMRRVLADCRLAALAVDGPLGPFHVVKPGAVRLASELSLAVMPVAAAGRRAWVLAQRWDRMKIPLPFTRVHLACGVPMRVPAGLSEQEVGSWCDRLRQEVEATGRRARRMAQEGRAPLAAGE